MKIRISAVSYLNTIPFIYGIEKNPELLSQIELSKDIPSECARKLMSNEVDLGLVPVAIIPKLDQPHILSDFCIGANGKVDTVLLLSDLPLGQIEKIILDYQSRTSINLCKVLCREFWNIDVEYENAEAGFENSIAGKTAGVIIGDRNFQLAKKYKYSYDLAEEWLKMTKLPFVFAAWVSNKKLPENFTKLFNKAISFGIKNIEAAVEQDKNTFISKEAKKHYLNKCISYDYNEDKQKALQLFLSLIKE